MNENDITKREYIALLVSLAFMSDTVHTDHPLIIDCSSKIVFSANNQEILEIYLCMCCIRIS